MKRRQVRRAPHLQYWIGSDDCWRVEDTRNGQRYRECSDQDFHRRVADLSVTDDYYPIGNHIGRVTKALGIEPCLPCEKRRAMLNRLVRRIGSRS